jgi:hypothetical protein
MPYPYSDITGQLSGAGRSQASITRPANTTAYAVGDVVAGNGVTTPIALPVNRNGGKITHVRLTKSGDTITNATFRVHFFDASHTIAADNAQLTSVNANRANYLGYVDLPAMVQDGAGSNIGIAKDDDVRIPFSGDTVYAVITAVAAYTPASAEVFNLSIGVE